MKTKNLNAWCNLFLIASKYDFSIQPSKHSAVVDALTLILMPVFILAFFVIHFELSFHFFGLLLLSTPAVIVYQTHCYQQQKTLPLTVYLDGQCLWQQSLFQVSAHSRVGPLAITLKLLEKSALFTQKPTKSTWLFAFMAWCYQWLTRQIRIQTLVIYQDSLSEQEYARLSRVVIKLAGELHHQQVKDSEIS